jgi:phage replication O-like protein O
MPQLENGYLRIANELLEQFIVYGFSSRQWAVLMAVARMTYGYNKKSDALSGWQISKITGIDRSHISKTLNELIKLNVINKHEEGRISHGVFVNEISINKNYETWLTVAKKVTVAESAPLPKNNITVAELVTVTVAELAKEPLPKQPTHKDISKDNKDNTKDIQFFSEINPSILKQWKAVRRKKGGAELSDIIYKAMVRESEKAGITLEQAIIICVERNWIIFKADWHRDSKSNTGNKFIQKDNELAEYNRLTKEAVKARLFGTNNEKDITDESERL